MPGGYLLRLRFDRVPDQLMAELEKLPGVTEVRSADRIAADVYADRGGPLIPAIVNAAQAAGAGCATCTSKSPVSRPCSCITRKEFARLNWKTFFALLSRDGHVARRNLLPMLLQNLLQPLLFVFVFGRIMTTSGIMRRNTRPCYCRASWPSAWCSRASRR